MKSKWGGEIAEVKENPNDSRGISGPATRYLYPEYKSKFEDHLIYIDISEWPSLRKGVYDSADNVEFLRIRVYKKSDYKIIVTQEGFADRFLKALKISWEFQTGNEEFDKKYFVDPRSEKDKEFLKNVNLQSLIQQLEPFSEFAIHNSQIHWSQEISDSGQISFNNVKRYMEILINIGKIIE